MAKLEYLDPVKLLKLGNLHLQARYVVEGITQGLHQSPYKGYSLEFAQHREYAPGDELKHIDWRVFGRTDKFFVKQYQEETNMKAFILLDVSKSMQFSSQSRYIDKLTYSINLVACIVYLLLKQEDSVGLVLFDTKIVEFIPPRAQFEQFSNIVRLLENITTKEETKISSVINEFSNYLKRRAMIIFVSDLLDDPETTLKSIKQLRFKHHDVIVFQVLDINEIKFDYSGPIVFEGIEQNEKIHTESDYVVEQYRRLFSRFIENYKTGFRNCGIDYCTITTDTPIELSLGTFLATRKQI